MNLTTWLRARIGCNLLSPCPLFGQHPIVGPSRIITPPLKFETPLNPKFGLLLARLPVWSDMVWSDMVWSDMVCTASTRNGLPDYMTLSKC